MLQEADDNYYITAQYLVELANKAYDIFKSSEVEERRQLIKLTLSNLTLEGKNVRYDLLKPFDTIAKYADRQSWLPLLDSLRNGYKEQQLEHSLEAVQHFTHEITDLLGEMQPTVAVV